ncbi:MAG: DUF547 domain-containing protein [Sphingomonadales bacterium]
MLKELQPTKFFTTILTLVLLTFLLAPVYGQGETDSADPFARFGTYSEGSDWAIDHSAWETILYATVVVIQPSSINLASVKPKRKTGTRITRGSSSPARNESNRVLFHLIEEEHLALVRKYRRELESLTNSYPLADFNKDEQLAYWLNLHNAVLFEQLAERYPISKLKGLRLGKSNRPALWDEKLVTVEGVALSLNDIQNKILIRHWASPMVLYGLYQGSIGGPSLPNRAFTGENVNRLLKQSAKEFVNSNRGVKFWGTTARVSVLYDLGKSAFPNWETDLAAHLNVFANATLRVNLAGAETFTPKLYDWSIADTKGGTLSSGPALNTAANLLSSGAGGTGNRGGTMSLLGTRSRTKANGKIDDREEIITTLECGTGPCPDDEPDDDQGGDN